MQLPLAIEFPDTASFAGYEAGANTLLLDLLKKTAIGEGELQLYIWAERGLGKTHLLQSTCRFAAEKGRRTCYLPATVLREHGPQILNGLEDLDLIAIDDLEQIVLDLNWQKAMFSLINSCRNTSACLLLAAGKNIPELNLELADLYSRLGWGPVFEIKPLNDTRKKKVLQNRARQRSLELNDESVNYLLSRYPRDMHGLCDLLETLDKASLSAQRRLTVPFIKSVLEVKQAGRLDKQ